MKLKAVNISKSFEDKKIVDDVSVDLNEGELVGLLGVSGAGKTTLFNVLSGIIRPDTGRVLLDDVDVTGLTGKVGYMLQKDLLLPHKKIIDNVALPLILSGANKKEARLEAIKYFSTFGIDGTQDKYPYMLSGGMRQRVAFLRTYLMKKEVMLLDEPFNALDTITKQVMHSWYLEKAQELKLSTILITHDIDEAVYMADRIYILGDKPGRIIKQIVINRYEMSKEDFIYTENAINIKKEITELIK